MIFIGVILLTLGIILQLAAWIVQVTEAFKVHVGWGLASVLGFFVLGGIPNLIFCVANIKERYHPLLMWVGSILPILIGGLILLSELGLQFIPPPG